jgi:hypothetical protein
MIQKKDLNDAMRKFAQIRARQLLAVTAALWSMVILAVLSKRPDLFGDISNGTISALQISIIFVFISFSAWNWRCPVCKKYLAPDIRGGRCRKCGTWLGKK